MAKEKILLIIAARSGSKSVKNKNIRELCGLPLIAYTILQAKRWGKADRIICSTDSQEIASIAKEYGAEVPFIRPSQLATDTVGKIDVLKHALKTVEEQNNEVYPIVIDLDVTAPIRQISDIEKMLQLFLEQRPKSIFSVTPSRRNPYFNMVEINSDGYAIMAKNTNTPIKSRQEAPPVYDMNASIYIYDRDFLLDEKTKISLSDNTLIYIMDELSAFDIDNEVDFQFIEFLILKGLVKL